MVTEVHARTPIFFQRNLLGFISLRLSAAFSEKTSRLYVPKSQMLHWLQNPSSLFFDLYYKYTEYQQDRLVNKRLNYQQLDGFVNLWGW